MPTRQSPVLAGKLDQRDRSRRKKHHNHRGWNPDRDLRTKTTENNWERKLRCFQTWLRAELPLDSESVLHKVSGISLTKFLQNSPAILDIGPDERLRQLAIHVEHKCTDLPQPKGWKTLERIYQEALKYDNSWPFLYHSMSLSLRACAGTLNCEDPVKRYLLKQSIMACDTGLSFSPNNATLFSSRGRTNYELGFAVKALKDHEAAMKLDPTQMWAALYRAHALHDLERWEEAVQAYRSVNVSFFDGDQSWRAVLLKDQLAYCHLKAGNREKALKCFESAIHRYESNPGLLTTPTYLISAAQGEFNVEIGRRVLKLLRRDDLEYWVSS